LNNIFFNNEGLIILHIIEPKTQFNLHSSNPNLNGEIMELGYLFQEMLIFDHSYSFDLFITSLIQSDPDKYITI
jgi:hypothetical protein